MILSSEDKHTLVHALRVAAERFTEDAQNVTGVDPRLVAQFERQAADTRRLADALDDADVEIAVSTPRKAPQRARLSLDRAATMSALEDAVEPRAETWVCAECDAEMYERGKPSIRCNCGAVAWRRQS